MSPDGYDPTPGELGRQLNRIESRLNTIDQRLEDRYVRIGDYNSAIRVLDEKVEGITESQRWVRRAVVTQALVLVGGIILLFVAAAL